MTQTGSHAFYLDTERGPTFAFLDVPDSAVWSGVVVVIVGPWGWDEVVTNRSRKDWEGQLVGLGHAALRIDLPGSGDSGGIPSDPGLVDGWVSAVSAAVAFGRRRDGCRRVAVIGLGLGGLVAGEAIRTGSQVDDLVLWATPTTGRAFIREARAFSRLQTSRFSLTGEPEPSLLPDDWMEVGGFVLSAETIAALGSLALTTVPGGALQRVLLLERDGLPIDADVKRHLETEGVVVEVAAGDGWAAMCADLEQHRPPLDVFSTVGTWLGAVASATPAGRDLPAVLQLSAEIGSGQAAVCESPFSVEQPFGRVFGILAEPLSGTPSSLCAVFLNAGAVRRIGPNRMWVEAARRWAARGIPSLRLDVEGIGEADGDAGMYKDVGAFYRPEVRAQVVEALNALEARGLGPRFVLIGLCAGAYWAFRVTLEDPRIGAVALFNARALVWDPHLSTRREARAAQKVLTRESWGRFLRGEIKLSRIASVSRAVALRVAHRGIAAVARRLRRGPDARDPLEASFDHLSRKGTNVLLAFSNDEVLGGELEESGLLGRFEAWPHASFVRLPGRDHTVRPIVAQQAVHGLIDDVLAGEVARVAEAPR
jgi:alpha-beta hydrolase superfamily lysophospholipase